MSSGKAAPAGHDVECALCHLPVRSAVARARRVGGRCWRKLRADQRAALTRLTRGGRSLSPYEARAALARPAPAGTGQLPLPREQLVLRPPGSRDRPVPSEVEDVPESEYL
ncbi:hypothetical protein [Streptomyces sp. DSM 40484]|uniref:hypothetical protein n=1 Tax=Streptomyces kroppenstedtii TaxID=3051181 RepID=UPI0028D84F7B|nr:hypothetical protein [Streptomyces sp. DSM 40484]